MTALAASLQIFLTWLIAASAFVGIGLILLRSIAGAFDPAKWIAAFWIGFALAVLFLQVWHFWFPVDARASAIVGMAGFLGIAANWRELLAFAKERLRRHPAMCLICVAGVLWIANRATGPVGVYDSGLYHLSGVRWASTFPIVPGLGNLHSRLALNNSSFLYDALFEFGPWHGRSSHIANGLLVAALLVQILVAAGRAIRLPHSAAADWFDLTLCGAVVYLAFHPAISSPTTDLPAAVVALVIASTLLSLLTNASNDERAAATKVLVIAMLSATAVVLKTSMVAFGSIAWVMSMTIWWRRTSNRSLLLRTITPAIVFSTLLLATWAARGVKLSGYPLYPLTVGAADVDWRLPTQRAGRDREQIILWSRYYYETPPRPIEGKNWIGEWLRKLPSRARREMIVPSVVSLVGLGLLFLCRALRGPEEIPSNGLWLLLPTLGGVAFWFLSAPAPRFGFFLFWILAATGVALAATCASGAFLRVACLLLAIAPAGNRVISRTFEKAKTSQATDVGLFIPAGPDRGLHPTPRASMRMRLTDSGLAVFVPAKGEQCWDATLPATPQLDPQLRLRRDGDLAGGFTTRRRQ